MAAAMTPALLRLAAHLLDVAGAKFGDHVCNDIDLSKHLDAEGQSALARAVWEANGSQPDEDPADGNLGDWQVMHALARMLRQQADGIVRCKHCGYQVAPIDGACPACGETL